MQNEKRDWERHAILGMCSIITTIMLFIAVKVWDTSLTTSSLVTQVATLQKQIEELVSTRYSIGDATRDTARIEQHFREVERRLDVLEATKKK